MSGCTKNSRYVGVFVIVYRRFIFFCTLSACTELDMGPFLLTQSNPIHQLMDPIQSTNSWIQSNPIHKVVWKSWPNPIKNSWY